MATIKSNVSNIIEKAFTPIIVAAFGFWLNSSVQETQQEISKLKTEMDLRIAPIKEMKPYIDMLSDPSSETKNILGAYGIYMLKEGDNSRIAAQMIASMKKDYLVDILKTLGKDDDSVQKVLDELGSNNYDLTPLEYSQADQSTRDSLKLTPMQRYALEVKGSIEQTQLRTISDLVDKMNDAVKENRLKAVEELIKNYRDNSVAIEQALSSLEPPKLDALSASGRINVLVFLRNTDQIAWTKESSSRAELAIMQIRSRVEKGVAIGPQTKDALDQLSEYLDVLTSD